MKLEQVAVQLYTLRDFLKTPEDYAKSLQKVAEIGYRSVQVSGPRPLPPAEIRKLCDRFGLTLNSTHENSVEILQNPQQVVRNLQEFGCKYTAYPYPANIDFGSAESIQGLIDQLNAAGKVLADAGLVLTYHNHHHEFRKFDGKVILEKIYAETNPEYVQGEIDTYWVQYGGGDPTAWCRKLTHRLPMLHLKDYMVTEDYKVSFTEIGNGVLDFRSIIDAAEASGCQWFIVEQDSCPGDPFVSLAKSFNYIRDNLISR